jgi:L-threonate 2-dehydrogenase
MDHWFTPFQEIQTMTTPAFSRPTVGVFGLGSMGFGMAASLLKAQLPTAGFDISADQEKAFADQGGKDLGNRKQAAAQLDVAVIVVVNAAQTEDVLFGTQGIAADLKAGALVMSCATVDPDFARQMEARLADQGVLYLDSPISGGAIKAADGALSIMASGTPAAFEAAEPALEAMAETVFRLGDVAGPGSAMKIVNQLLAGVHIAAAAEAVTFGLSQGVDAQSVYEVISKCAGTSWMFENRVPHILEDDYAPRSAVDIFVKDLGIVADAARKQKFAAPLASTALDQFVMASGSGFGKEDDAAVAKVYAARAGLELPKK